jgi:hypothetical protein
MEIDVKQESRYWTIRPYESEKGDYQIVEKIPSWAFEGTKFVGMATIIRQVRTIHGVQNIPEPVQFIIPALSISEAFEKFRSCYDAELEAMNQKQGVIQVATGDVNKIPFQGGKS